MINEIFEKLSLTENCRILNSTEIQELRYLHAYDNVIQVKTEVSFTDGIKEIVFYVCIPDVAVSLPKIFIDQIVYEDIKYLPHINSDLSICVYDDNINHVFQQTSLPDIVEEMLYRAKGIVLAHNSPEALSQEFEGEFKAYWELSYVKADVVNEIGLSIITDDLLPIKGYRFENLFNGYRYVIFQETEIFNKFKDYLDFQEIRFTEIEVFHVNYTNTKPPFNLYFSDSVKFISEVDIKSFKKAINKNGFQSVIAVFKNVANEYFGWVYNRTIPAHDVVSGRRVSLSAWQIITEPIFKNSLVERLSFSDFTPGRLDIRTSGLVQENRKSICIAGLGSVGSNLLNLIIKLPINKFRLIDPDILKIENVYRSHNGFDRVGRSKVEIAKEDILNKNPFCDVVIDKSSIVDVLKKESHLLSTFDVNVVVVGRTLIEKHILENLVTTNCEKPLVLIWVEPFLASGQMMCIMPSDFSKAIEMIMNFPFCVIDDSDKSEVYLKEGSCQTGYFPYSETNLTLFLSSIFPHLFHFIQGNTGDSSKVYSWIGDKRLLSERGIKLTEFGNSKNSFETIITDL